MHLTGSKFHSLQVTDSFVPDAGRVREGRSKLTVGQGAVKSDRNEFTVLRLPLEINKAVGEENGESFDPRVGPLGTG